MPRVDMREKKILISAWPGGARGYPSMVMICSATAARSGPVMPGGSPSRLSTAPGRATRPTSDRTREGLFGTVLAIRGTLDGAAVADLYAGSGAVGLEATLRDGSGHLMGQKHHSGRLGIRLSMEDEHEGLGRGGAACSWS